MLSLKYRIFVVSVLVAVLAAAIQAAPTQPISYQGRLTNTVGSPVANGTYNVTFAIYDDPSSGSLLWKENQDVTISGGLFSTLLGSVTPFDPALFKEFPRYLGITIDAGSEMSPRILMASVPYALTAPGGAGGYWSQSGSNIYYNGGNVGIGMSSPASALEVNGDVTVSKSDGPRLTLKDNKMGYERPRISFNGDFLSIFDGDATTGHIFSFMNTFGPVRDYDASLRIHGRTGYSWGTFLDLTHDGTHGIISTDVGDISLAPANGSVVLPDNAIDAREILDEPGIAENMVVAIISVPSYTYPNLVMANLVSVTITIPTAGYIVLEGMGTGLCTGTDYTNQCIVNIDSDTGGVPSWPNYVIFGGDAQRGAYYPLAVSRTFFRNGGTYTFYLKASQFFGNTAGASDWIENPSLRATYYPSSYGSVTTLVSSGELGQFENATAVQTADLIGNGSNQQLYQVDLRELELKAAKLRAETEKAERQVAEAKMNEMQKQRNQTASDKK